jgi:hypothetical protein
MRSRKKGGGVIIAMTQGAPRVGRAQLSLLRLATSPAIGCHGHPRVSSREFAKSSK